MNLRRLLLIAGCLLSILMVALLIHALTHEDTTQKATVTELPSLLPTRTQEPLPAGINRMGSVLLVHQTESNYIDIPNDIKVYPAPDANISMADYQRGSVFGSLLSSTPYNVCVFVQIITNKVCVPRMFITPPPSEDWECPILERNWGGTDFRPYVQIYLDGELISGEQANRDGALEEYDPMIHNAFFFCYQFPLDPGVHRMSYDFSLSEENIHDTAEWSFTITP